jgi:hypothetical protein
MLETVRVITSFQDVTMMLNTIPQCSGHFGVAKNLYPFTEFQVGGYDE